MEIKPLLNIDVEKALKGAPDEIRNEFLSLDLGLQEVMADLWVKSRDPDRRALYKHIEQDRLAQQVNALIRDSGIPEKYRKGFDDLIINAANRMAIRDCVSYANGWTLRGAGLALFGDVGVGKTQLACTVGLRLIRHELIEVRFAGVIHAFELARLSFDTGRGNPIPGMMSCGLLILDDLGSHKSTEWTMEQILLITDYRTMRDLPMIITSNAHSWKELAGKFGGHRSAADPDTVAAIIDRLREALGDPVVMRGRSWRKTGGL